MLKNGNTWTGYRTCLRSTGLMNTTNGLKTCFDFDDMIHEAVRLFDKRPAILRRYRSRSPISLSMSSRTPTMPSSSSSSSWPGITSVWSRRRPDIYRFRGAYLTNMQDFRQTFSRLHRVPAGRELPQHPDYPHPCPPADAACPNRHQKRLITANRRATL